MRLHVPKLSLALGAGGNHDVECRGVGAFGTTGSPLENLGDRVHGWHRQRCRAGRRVVTNYKGEGRIAVVTDHFGRAVRGAVRYAHGGLRSLYTGIGPLAHPDDGWSHLGV